MSGIYAVHEIDGDLSFHEIDAPPPAGRRDWLPVIEAVWAGLASAAMLTGCLLLGIGLILGQRS